MKKITAPNFTVHVALERSVENSRDGGLQVRLLGAIDEFNSAEHEYAQKGPANELYSIAPSAAVGDWVDGSEMKKLYTQAFARKGSKARYIYDAILNKAPGGLCPLCSQRPATTLDHYLAKTRHPALAITPLNLVPACKDCNTDTKVRVAKTASEQTLHPYFDDVDDEIWLTASVVPVQPPAVLFKATPPGNWPLVKQDMVRSHFTAFSLGTLFTTHAATELVNVYFDITGKGTLPSQADLQAHLRERAANRRHVTKNSWQAAMYDGLADSDWFCSGGFREIVHSTLIER